MATIPTSEGGLAWNVQHGNEEDADWVQAVAQLPDGRSVSVFGHTDAKMEGEWMGTVSDGKTHGNMGYADGTPHIRKALRYFAQKLTPVKESP